MRIPDEFLECVCFLGTLDGGQFTFRGTGFFISYPSAVAGQNFIYLVTAKHCVTGAKGQQIYLRLNNHEGGSGFIQLNKDWHFHPTTPSSDIAVMAWAPNQQMFSYKFIPSSMIADAAVVSAKGIGVGDDIVMIGLFVRHFGQKRNLPIVRSGIVASMPDELIADGISGLSFRAYIAEVRSIGGLSGSPVLGVIGPIRTVNGKLVANLEYVLLGIVRGHWDEKVDQPKEGKPGSDEVNMGMAVITPADELAEIINCEALVTMRKNHDDDHLKASGPIQD